MGILLYLGITKKYIIPLLSILFILGFIIKNWGGFECGFGRYIYSLTTSVHIFKFCIGILFAMFYDHLKRINLKGWFGLIFAGVQLVFLVFCF